MYFELIEGSMWLLHEVIWRNSCTTFSYVRNHFSNIVIWSLLIQIQKGTTVKIDTLFENWIELTRWTPTSDC